MTATLDLPLDTCAASMAARSPAMPEPMITTSKASVSTVRVTSALVADVEFAMLHEYKSE